MYLIAQRSKIILVFGVFHEIPVIDDEKYQCRGGLYIPVWLLGAQEKSLLLAQDHLSCDKWHLSLSDWSRALELVT